MRINVTDVITNHVRFTVLKRNKKGEIKYNSGHIQFNDNDKRDEFISQCENDNVELVVIRNLTARKAPPKVERGKLFCPWCGLQEVWKNDNCPVCGVSVENFHVRNVNQHLWGKLKRK